MNQQIVQANYNYKELLCYKKAVVIYDLTYHFCNRFLVKYDRTFNQMIQAARSGKQNIVEGSIDKSSSYEMAISLINVARGSYKELLEDYTDYLRARNLQLWDFNSKEVTAMRKYGIEHYDPQTFVRLAENRNDEVIANMVIVLLYQEDTLLMRYLNSIENEFQLNGGIKEKMYSLRPKTWLH
ncbi:MAG: four helix bundle suffix domain-containing protein [Alistipes sp.]|nr:four helix bundle suffix domain-containing protein [Alistipes sp.]MBQ8774988.1 four helix bundle suffix domain-containing protein [Alistipes sp.]